MGSFETGGDQPQADDAARDDEVLADDAQDFVFGRAFKADVLGGGGVSRGEVAGFVERECGQSPEVFEIHPALDQSAAPPGQWPKVKPSPPAQTIPLVWPPS